MSNDKTSVHSGDLLAVAAYCRKQAAACRFAAKTCFTDRLKKQCRAQANKWGKWTKAIEAANAPAHEPRKENYDN
jgi:hypothetical protein